MKTKSVYKGRLLHLLVGKKALPNGYVVRFEIIRHPGAVLVIPFLAKNRIILLRQLRPVIDSYIYELPAGTLDKGESHLSCAKREIIEETGYSARRFTKLGQIYPVPGYSTEKIIIYKAGGLKKEKRVSEKDEVIEHFEFTKKKIRQLFKSGRIIDAKTICGLTMCGWLCVGKRC